MWTVPVGTINGSLSSSSVLTLFCNIPSLRAKGVFRHNVNRVLVICTWDALLLHTARLTINVSFPLLFWAEVPAPRVETGQGDITRSDTRLRVAVTTVPPHQSHLSDRCMCATLSSCQRVLRMVMKSGMDVWGWGGKQSFKVHHSPLLFCSFSAVNLLDTTTITGDWGWLTYPSHGVRLQNRTQIKMSTEEFINEQNSCTNVM